MYVYTNVQAATTPVDRKQVPVEALRSVPMGLLTHCNITDRSQLQAAKSIRVPTDIQSMNTVLKWVRNGKVRKQMYVAGNSCATENLKVRTSVCMRSKKPFYPPCQIVGVERID